MMLVIGEHVAHDVAYLARRAQHTLVKAIRVHATPRAHDSVQPLRHANEERAHTLGHRPTIIGLGHEVQVIPLHREVHDPKPLSPAHGTERSDNRPKAALRA